ncbi:SCO family protein [Gorillibacterium sp. sgz5001074]|uniref:SCO family protein n=1 Tax=Gorillibacterium sp. sgz5001074 TaxID=3446695 RepID=UPI003F667650
MSATARKNPPVWALVAGIAVLLVLGAAILYQTLGNQTSKFNYDKPGPDFTLQNLDGKNVTLHDTDGKARLVYFYYASCPDVCPMTTYLLSQVQDKLKEKDAFGTKTAFYSITFDPVKDTTEALKEFAGRFHADLNGWYFLRGEEAYSLELARKWEIGVAKQANGDIAHTNVVFLVDKKGQIRHYYNANDLELSADTIAKDLLALSKAK